MHLCRGNSQSSDYYVDVSPPPSQVTSSSIITITCYQDEGLRVAIPSNVVWTKINQGWHKKLSNRGHSYVCTPNDIGSSIQVEVTANHNQFGERNSIKINFQTIKLDPLLRPTIEHIIKNSIASFAVTIISGNKSKQYLLHISDIDIQIKDPRTGSNIKSTYSAIQPQFIQNFNDSCMITQIIPKENEEDYLKFFGNLLPSDKSMSIKIRFDDKSLRDSFILARKAFVVKRQVRLFNIIQNSLDSTISNPNSVDLLIEMSSIKSFNEYLLKKKQMYKNEVEVLQEQIINLKNTYQGILKQKIQKVPQKSKFDAVLSLLDSSMNSKRFGLGLNNSDLIHGFDFSQKMKLQVIGQQNNILESGIRINTSENIIYSQVFPFNQSRYSKKRSLDQPIRNQIIQHNSRSQISNTDPESILNSSNQINSNLDNSLNPRFQKDADKSSKIQLYVAWQEQAHKNFMLQSKILQLQNVIANSKIIENTTPSGQTYLMKQNNSLHKSVSQKQEVIQLLSAENTNLKLQIDNSNTLREAYRIRCSQMQKSIQNSSSFSLQSFTRFQQKLNPITKQSQKLLKQSKHLNELLKSAIDHQIHK